MTHGAPHAQRREERTDFAEVVIRLGKKKKRRLAGGGVGGVKERKKGRSG